MKLKVRCERLINHLTGDTQKHSSWLTIGHIYEVLEIYHDKDNGFLFRIIGDDGLTPALHQASQFSIVDSSIPSNWIVSFQDNEIFELAPERWLTLGFWDDYFNGDQATRDIFIEEKNLM